jgi:hypothetical protein
MGSVATPEYSGKWSYWNGRGGPDRIPHNPDSLLPTGLPDIMSVYHPVIGLYDLTDPDAVDYYYQSMKMAGIDAESTNLRMLSDWRLKSMKMRIAAMKKYGIKGIVRYEDKEHFRGKPENENKTERYQQVLHELNTWFDLYKPVQFTLDDRPVVMFFTIHAPDSLYLAWKNSFRKSERPLLFFWPNQLSEIADGDFEWIGARPHKDSIPKAPYRWSITSFEIIKHNRQKEVERARQRLQEGSIKYHMDAASPGFNDTGSWGWGKGPRLVERFDGRTYEYRWQEVVEEDFDHVIIPTWDDWGEGSVILPTVQLGYRELEATRKWIADYKVLEPDATDLKLPEYIYKIRKKARENQNQEALTAMDKASDDIAEGMYTDAMKNAGAWLHLLNKSKISKVDE